MVGAKIREAFERPSLKDLEISIHRRHPGSFAEVRTVNASPIMAKSLAEGNVAG